MTDPDHDPLLTPPMPDDELAEIRQRIREGARAYQQLDGMLPWAIHLQVSTDIPHLLGEVERLHALLAKVRDYVGEHGDGEVDVWSLREVLAGREVAR